MTYEGFVSEDRYANAPYRKPRYDTIEQEREARSRKRRAEYVHVNNGLNRHMRRKAKALGINPWQLL